MRILLVPFALLGLAACATGTVGESAYQRDLATLEKGCRARDGVLVPTGAMTGRPATEFACNIGGGATRIDR